MPRSTHTLPVFDGTPLRRAYNNAVPMPAPPLYDPDEWADIPWGQTFVRSSNLDAEQTFTPFREPPKNKWNIVFDSEGKVSFTKGSYGYKTRREALEHYIPDYKAAITESLRTMNRQMNIVTNQRKRLAHMEKLQKELAASSKPVASNKKEGNTS